MSKRIRAILIVSFVFERDEAIVAQLAHETRELAVRKVVWQHIGGQFCRICDGETAFVLQESGGEC